MSIKVTNEILFPSIKEKTNIVYYKFLFERVEILNKLIMTDKLIKDIQSINTKLGRTPLIHEFTESNIACDIFGNWNNFLLASRLEPLFFSEVLYYSNKELILDYLSLKAKLKRNLTKNEYPFSSLIEYRFESWDLFMQKIYTEEKLYNELIKDIQELTQLIGYVPTKNRYKKSVLAISLFGKWTNFLSHADLSIRIPERVTNKSLIKDIILLQKKLDRIPNYRDFHRATLAVNRFGSWNDFLKAANIKSKNNRFSDDFYVSRIKDLANKLGRTPLYKEYKYNNSVVSRFGSWNKFLILAGLTPTNIKNVANPDEIEKVSNDLLIIQLKNILSDHNKVPTPSEFPNAHIAVLQFGSWNKFLKAAGLKPRQYKYSDKLLISEVKILADKLNRAPRTVEFAYSNAAIHSFKSWNKFLLTAGLKPNNTSTKITNETLLKEVKLLAQQLNKTPVYRDYQNSKLAANRFGSWNKFLEEAGLKKPKKT